MVRFKNRYILGDVQDQISQNNLTQKEMLKIIKDQVLDFMGQVFLAKITFSLQIKYFYLGRVVIRVPRQYSSDLIACLFSLKGIKIKLVSGTIRCIQKKVISQLRKQLLREPNGYQLNLINKIDYS